MFLSKCLQIALELEKLGGVKPDGTKTKWIDCCRLAVERAKLMGYRGVAADTIMEWNRHFCRDASGSVLDLPTVVSGRSRSQQSLNSSPKLQLTLLILF